MRDLRVQSRRARATTIAGTIVLALVLGACATVAPAPAANANPATCVARLTSAADYQRAFDTRGPVWSGGDGAAAIPLPDGRVLWLFGDTFTGPVVANRRVPPTRLVRSSALVQTGRCFQPTMGGTAANVADLFPSPEPGEWYWPAHGWADASGRSVHVFVMRMRQTAGLPGWDWTTVDMRLATLSLPDLRVQSISALPFPAGGDAPAYGSSVAVGDDGFAYVYGELSVPGWLLPQAGQYVARVPADLSGGWQFWDGSEWSADPSAAAPMTFTAADLSPDAGPSSSLNVVRYGSGWLGVAKRWDMLSGDVTAWYASTPEGPWRAVNDDDGTIALTPVPAGSTEFTYGGHVVDAPGAGPVVVYSVNGSDATVMSDARVYGPRVVAPSALPSPDELAAS